MKSAGAAAPQEHDRFLALPRDTDRLVPFEVPEFAKPLLSDLLKPAPDPIEAGTNIPVLGSLG